MATILCLTSKLAGVLYPGVELARRLQRAGHRVVYASFADARPVVERQGLEFEELEPSRLDTEKEAGLVSRLVRLRDRRRRALESLALAGWERTIRRIEPDLLLLDGEMHEHVLAAYPSGRKIALLNSFVSIWRRPGLPPPHCLARPGVGWKGSRPGMWLLWQVLFFRKWWKTWAHKVRHAGCDRLSLLRALARDRGVDFRGETDPRQWLIPFTYRRLPVLSLHAREFELPHRPPGRVTYVGPMLLEERGGPAMPRADREALDALFERRREGGPKLIYAGFGSFLTAGRDFLRRLVRAVAAHDDRELVLSLGGRLDPANLEPLPPGVHAFRWVPQLEVLRHADAAVTHGGINTIDECVLHGVPMLVYCGFQTDMGGNTSRVVHHGLGLAGDPGDSPEAIRHRLDRLLREPEFRNNVQQMRERYQAYAENRVAERAVESLLDGP